MRQAETQCRSAEGAVTGRLPEAYQWLLVPEQTTPQSPVQWQAYRLSGQESLAPRAGKKLRSEELLVTSLAGTRLRMELDRTPLWRGDHVAIRQLAEDFARYIYLPRLRDSEVLLGAIRDGLGLLLWERESFAYADGFDEATHRYRGLRCGQSVQLVEQFGEGLVVKPEVALRQREADQASATSASGGVTTTSGSADESGPGKQGETAGEASNGSAEANAKPKRYYGTVKLDAARVGRDAGRIAEEVIAHLSGLVGATVTVTLEIEAIAPDGVPDNVVRTVIENSRTLKFDSQGFEKE